MNRAAILGLGLMASVACAVGAIATESNIAAIDRLTTNLFRRSGLPGLAVSVVHGDRIAYERGFGTDGRGGSVTPDTLFILGSTSKSLTALCILQLFQAGRLRLDDPAARYLTGFLHNGPASAKITIRSLLNQTSGLSHAAGDQPVMEAGESGPNAIRNFALSLGPASLNRTPGTSYEYSNANYVVLGAIVETVSGQPFADYLRAHVFVPLGMSHSHASLPSDIARGHKQFLGVNYVSDLPYPDSFVPAGFIVSSANDLAKYLSAQLPGSTHARELGLSDENIALWHHGVALTDPQGKGHYAMGWATDTFNGVPVIWHSGDTGVFSSEFTLEPKGRWGVVVLADGSGWLSQDYLQEISSGIVNILAGRAPRDDTNIHRIVRAIYVAVLALPFIQLLALWRMRNRKTGWVGQAWPATLHIIAAFSLIVALPRMLFGIPFTELLTSFPDMAAAGLLSAAAALASLVQAVRLSAGRKSPA